MGWLSIPFSKCTSQENISQKIRIIMSKFFRFLLWKEIFKRFSSTVGKDAKFSLAIFKFHKLSFSVNAFNLLEKVILFFWSPCKFKFRLFNLSKITFKNATRNHQTSFFRKGKWISSLSINAITSFLMKINRFKIFLSTTMWLQCDTINSYNRNPLLHKMLKTFSI